MPWSRKKIQEDDEPELGEDEDEGQEMEEDISNIKKAVGRPSKPSIPEQTQQIQDVWVVKNEATETQPFVYNQKTKKIYTIHQALVEILNRLE